MSTYCTYITLYLGDKFPLFYVGSSSVRKILNGYRGSVSSKRYKTLWKEELRHNPNLFITTIINTHTDRKESLAEELEIQNVFGVVESPLFINLSLAKTNGFFGMDVSGENNPRFGKKWGDAHPRGMLGKTHSEENVVKFLKRVKNVKKMHGKTHTEETKRRMSESHKGRGVGRKLSEESKKKISETRKKRGIVPWNKGKSKSTSD